MNINSDEPSFYPYSVEINKYSGSSKNINNPYAKLCVPDAVKNINVEVFNLMSRTNEARHKNGMKLANVNVDQMQVFVIINNIGIIKNANVNVKKGWTKEDVMKDLFDILVIVNANVINHLMLENVWIIQVVSVEKG